MTQLTDFLVDERGQADNYPTEKVEHDLTIDSCFIAKN